ncbi:MAG: PD-(D/E)XK nuclease family protein [Thermovirgaceae bacterium]|jgi:RecB family exonuclease|nr:PD-(D/E)XK nuclease family protein [Synergistales bacterium]MDI9392975.1 PD-(D/E)XK nuclease family protein [Synergistota bacterium]NLV65899.1 Dna2/Cas4 domain-containing protein [Synergistaceae bacterium]MDD3830924.1 PD-(D/E)XK nuclease family protein [Synergistales bacterium]MDD5515338.1 PD-(D/E)XK nuclease family protein [Synergistales bacterium]
MPVRIAGYYRVGEIEAELAQLGRERDPSPLFLVPSPGDRELLRDILVESVSFGSSEPPVLRWEDLYREASREMELPREKRKRQIDPPDHWLIVRRVLKCFMARVDEQSIPPGVRHGGFVWTLGEDLRELLREEVDPEALALSLGCISCTEGPGCTRLPAPGALLCRLYRDYLSYLEHHSLTDSAQSASITRNILSGNPARAASWVAGRAFVFAGFMSFTRSQTGLIRQLSSLGARVIVFMPESGLDIHDARAQLTTNLQSANSRTIPEPVPLLPVSAGDHRMELETLARNLSLWSAGGGEFHMRLEASFPGWGNIGLYVDPSRLGCAEEILARYRIPYTVNGGPRVSETPLWKTASSAIEAGSLGYPAEETAHILSQPWISPAGFPLSRCLNEGPRGEDAWRSFLGEHGDSGISAFFERMASFVSFIARGGTPSELLRSLRSLSGMGDPPDTGLSISRFIIDHPSLDETARRLNAAVRELDQKLERMAEMETGIGPAGVDTLKGGDAVAFLSAWSERSTVWQPPGKRNSLHLYAGSPPVLARHRIFIATGLTADAWPGRLRESPLLNDSHKEAIHNNPDAGLSPSHLPLLREKRVQREALLMRTIATADELCIASHPSQDASGRPLQPSRFLDSAISRTPAWAVHAGGEPPFSRSMRDVLPRDDETVIEKVEARSSDPPRVPARIKMLPPATPWPSGMVKKVPVSGIDTWKACPFKFYASRVLKIEKGRPYGFDPLEAGNLVHAVWEKVWHERMDTGGNLTGLLEDCWDQAVEERYPSLKEFPRHMSRLKKNTWRMASLQQEMEDAGLAEARVSQEREQMIETDLNGVLFRGKFDRIDLLKDGSAIIFDYKTGRGNGLAGSMQLPAYAVLLEKARNIKTSGYAFLSQADCSVTGRLEGPAGVILARWKKRSRSGLADMVSLASETLGAMSVSVTESRFPPDYTNTEACRYCEFQEICRRKESPVTPPAEEEKGDAD